MKFQKFLYWFRWMMILSLLSRALSGGSEWIGGEPAPAWVPLLAAGGWTLYFAGKQLVPAIKRSGWLYRLYRYRSPARPGHLAHPPLRPGILERLYLHIRPPKWCRTSDDALMIVYRDQHKLLQEGNVVPCVFVQANTALFKRGVMNSPATVLYTTDAEMERPVLRLMEIAQKIYSLKGSKPEDPDERKFARMLSDELGREFRVTVPESLASGLDVTYTTIMVHRKHLPDGYLTGNYVPLLIHQESRAAMILPARYWPDEIISDWTPQTRNPSLKK